MESHFELLYQDIVSKSVRCKISTAYHVDPNFKSNIVSHTNELVNINQSNLLKVYAPNHIKLKTAHK